jgi:hypothetical protein
VTPIPISDLRFGPRSHASAMWWLGLLYRKPSHFVDALAQLPKRRQLLIAGVLLLQSLPYLLVVSVVGRGLIGWVGITFFVSLWNIALSIALGLAVGIAVGIALGDTVRIAAGIVLGIAAAIAAGVVLGIAAAITSGIVLGIAAGEAVGIFFLIAFGIAAGITAGIGAAIAFGIAAAFAFGIAAGIAFGIAAAFAFGMAVGIALLRVYYHLVHFWFVWPAIQGRLYPWHPSAWDDLCAVPFPGLGRLLVSYAEVAPEAAEAEIERLIDTYPSQRHQALIARTILHARTAAAETDLSRLDQAVSGIPEGEKGFLGETARVKELVGEIAALQRQLNTMNRPAFREPVADIFRDRIGGFSQPLAQPQATASAVVIFSCRAWWGWGVSLENADRVLSLFAQPQAA